MNWDKVAEATRKAWLTAPAGSLGLASLRAARAAVAAYLEQQPATAPTAQHEDPAAGEVTP